MKHSREHHRPPTAAAPPLNIWTPEPLPESVRTVIARIRRAEDVVHVAIMPDVHIAGPVCTGGVVATLRTIYPRAVGGDIGCGYSGVATDVAADVLEDEARVARLFASLRERIPFMRHRSLAGAPGLPASVALDADASPVVRRVLGREARIEFGTLGRGNHFVELQADEEDRVWVMVHSGSRVLGPAVAGWHMENAGTSHRNRLIGLDADTDAGRAFLRDADLAERFAAAGRDQMLEQVVMAMGELASAHTIESTRYNTSHNHVRRESHEQRGLWVHRKGANSAAAEEFNAIPGSMGTATFHVRGRGHAPALASSSHGAGRALTRVEARRRISSRALLVELGTVWTDPEVRDRLIEEAPSAYKTIDRVMRAQHELVRVIRRLRPLLVYKAP